MFGIGKKKESLSINPDNLEVPQPAEATRAEKSAMDIQNMSSEDIGRQVLDGIKSKFSGFGNFLKKGLERVIGGSVKGGAKAIETGSRVGTQAAEGLGKGLRAVDSMQERTLDAVGDLAEAGVDVVKQAGSWAKEGVRDTGQALAEGHAGDFALKGEQNDALAEMYNQGIDALAIKSKEVYGKAEARVKGWAGEVKTGFNEWQKQRAEGKRLKALESLQRQIDKSVADRTAMASREGLLKQQLSRLEGNSGLADELVAEERAA